MNNLVAYIPFSTGEILNGYKGVIYPKGLKYLGRWEKGRKVDEGTLENQIFKIKVKIKQGLIHKCTEIVEGNSNDNLFYKFNLPDIKIIQVGDYFKEEVSNTSECFFIFRGRKILFGGKPCTFINQNIEIGEIYIIYYGKTLDQKLKPVSTMDLTIENIHIIGQNMNSSPNGLTKIYLNGLKFKEIKKGLYFKEHFTVKNELFKALIETDFPNFKDTVKVSSKVLNFQVTLIRNINQGFFFKENSGLNIENAKPFRQDIVSFLSSSIFTLSEILMTLKQYSLTTKLISFSLVIKENWRSFELNYFNKKNKRLENLIDKDFGKTVKDEKCLIIFKNNERYEGKVVNGNFEGFGKYFYADGSMYVGEFKNNLRDGLGTFKFKDGRMYKGYWVKNLIHGKGYMIKEREKFYGVLERGKIDRKHICTIIKID